MNSFTDTATRAINFFRIRYPVASGEASLNMDLAGRRVSIQEMAAGGRAHRRFWVKVTQGAHIESIQMELLNGRLVRNLAAPDGTMAQRY
jgi:hypothetical protein